VILQVPQGPEHQLTIVYRITSSTGTHTFASINIQQPMDDVLQSKSLLCSEIPFQVKCMICRTLATTCAKQTGP